MPISEKQLQTLAANNIESNRETKECIKEALLALLENTDFENVRMTDIINRSGASRSGVYKNYKNKQEILTDIYREPIDDVINTLSDSIFDNLELIFRIGKKHEKAIMTILNAGLEHNFLRIMNERFEDASVSFYYPLWNGMIYNSFFEWARSGMEGSVEDAVRNVYASLKLVAESIETGLTNKKH